MLCCLALRRRAGSGWLSPAYSQIICSRVQACKALSEKPRRAAFSVTCSPYILSSLTRVYDVRSLQLVQTIETSAPVTSIEVSFDQQHITTAEGSLVRFFSAANLQQVKQHAMTAPTESASYCPAKRRFVAGGEDMWVHLYDYDTGQVSGGAGGWGGVGY